MLNDHWTSTLLSRVQNKGKQFESSILRFEIPILWSSNKIPILNNTTYAIKNESESIRKFTLG
jgi:hypothetical protein